ncbi:Vault protein inter-alpha-trypsin [Rubripirellula lacrimiformis]|uniref:Vault protein inter-alpha-trypsin n=1 Tax=Rubripirellula lacrimiformis TaxID=1930273 RepID=A0A517NK46_9BACT|nr:MprA protease, GlyGly-CTERM protein-sorting domain-containing form [Rubripirellula lacrimiformis]QDT07512.1 Vault protein inter-alpha-trypsin [Rubripirellula lacrimiformis]
MRQPPPRATLFVLALTAITLHVMSPTADAAGMLVADGGFGGRLEIENQDVTVTINNSVAVTQIDQTFVNRENRIVEALYTFPVPRGASVSNFSMWIGGKEMIGEVVEKQRAREIYDSYKRVKRDPGLLEQVDFKQFEMRIFPIPAGAQQRVRIEYYQELNLDHDWGTYVYPLATVAGGEPIDSKVQGRFSMNVNVLSEVPIKAFKSESHTDDFVIVEHTDQYAQAAMELTAGDLSRDIVMAFQTKRPRTGIDVVTSRPAGEDGYFMMTVTPGEDLSSTIEPMDYVFLLDISGSMARDQKMEISRRSVMAFIESLGDEDRFDCLAFNLTPTPLFQQTKPANKANLTAAAEFFAAQRARGGTVLGPALRSAYAYRDSDRPLNVVLLSDGLTQTGESDELMSLIGSRPEGVRVFCVGVGNEVNRPLLSQLASQAGGLAAFVSTEDSFSRQAHLMRQKLVRPAIEDLSVQFAGGEVSQVEPAQLGSLFYGTPLRLFGRYQNGGAVEVILRGKIQGSPWEQTVQVTLPADDKGNSPIERMWASRRVESLFAQERAGTGNRQDEIVRLCEGYSIVSTYASMLVLENNDEYRRWKIDRRNATRIARDRQSQQRTTDKLADLRKQNEMTLTSTQKTAPEDSATSDAASPSPAGRPDSNPAPSSNPAPTTRPNSGQNVDFTLPSSGGGGGGGAIDPITAAIALASAGAAAWSRRRRNDF